MKKSLNNVGFKRGTAFYKLNIFKTIEKLWGPDGFTLETSKLGPDNKHVRLCRPTYSLCCDYSTLSLWCESNHRQCVSKGVWLCSDTTLSMVDEIDFHIISSVTKYNSFLWFFQKFKYIKCTHRPYKNRQRAGCDLQTVVCWSWLNLTEAWP